MSEFEIEGNTLAVYAFVVKERKPVGTRDVTRGAKLSSPSVAHRQLQKLETLGLLEKNAYGDYTLKEKIDIPGYIWVGKDLVPRLLFYSLFFIGAFVAEITIIILSTFVINFIIETSFYFLTGITVIAMTLFLSEGIKLYKKLKPKNSGYNRN